MAKKTSNTDVVFDDIGSQMSRRVKQMRKERGWSLDRLSAVCGVSRSMLSQIERDEANPTLAVTMRIALAFGVSLGNLVETRTRASTIDLIRAEDRQYHYRTDSDCSVRTLSPLHLEKDVEFYEVRLQTGKQLRSAAHFQGTREFLTVEKGKIRIESAGDFEDLNRGDSANYRADVEHAISNNGRGEAVLFLVVIYPRS